ncbi:amidohydrolase family protein [Pontibacter ummariensis]|uniref:Amidohydrolase family protein n=1 Tax=Pontibacter ummariensis TaxID=1610492 RepID=A0A239ETS5_9BACT|nr:amidohydrolase family protein [Pontibacter ummariensis]PRY12783.1 amidohydrolase family protein [Pontibacter ummariensis]SNS47254.1 Amidohydrolase family protein [Pontibacter ummariensis]
MKHVTSLAMLLCGSLLLSCATSKQETYDLLLTNVNVVDVETGSLLPGQTVVIEEGIIQEITDAPSKSRYRAETVIDAQGKYLIPGLWDNHVHLRGGEALEEENKNLLPLFVANGVTTVRDAGGDLYPAIRQWKEQTAAGILTGPRILTAGPKLDGPNPTWQGSIEVATVAEVPAALDSLQQLGVDFVKIYDSTISGDVFLAIVEEAEKRGMQVSGHMPFSVKLSDAMAKGLDATEHLYYAFKAASAKEDSISNVIIAREKTDKPVGFYTALGWLYDTYAPARAQQLFQQMAENNTAVVPTLYISQVLDNLKYEDHSQDSYLPYMGEGIVKTYERRINSAKRQSDEWTAFVQKLKAKFESMVPEMQEAGVTILAGSDAGAYNSYVYPGISLHKELEKLVEAGLTPAQALRTATINGARFMGKADQFGTVAQGKTADLVLLEQNPLEDIKHTQDIHSVILGGKVYSATELQQMLPERSR